VSALTAGRDNLARGLPQRAAALGLLLGLAGFFIAPGPAAAAGSALAVAAAVAAPPLGLLAALATLPLHLHTRALGPLAVSSSELMVLAAALGSGPRWLFHKGEGDEDAARSPFPLHPSPFSWPTALFLASALLSLLVTEYPRLSLRELRTLILEPVLAFYLLLAWFPGRAICWPLTAFLAGAVAVALAGLVGWPFGWWVSEAEGVRRLQATYPSPNHLGLLLGRALPWLLALAWFDGRWRRPALFGALIVAAALLTTYSLGGWLGSFAALLTLAWALGRGRLLAAVTGLGAVVGLAGLAVFRTERLWQHLEPGRGTTFFRLQLWQSALAMVRDHPLLGVGLDNFLYLYQQRYILPGARAEANLSHPHNLVLHFWLQLGLPGLVAALWLLAAAFTLAHRLFYTSYDRLTRALAIGAAASLVDFVVHGLIDNSYFLPDLAIVFWLTLALLEAGRRREMGERR
jgi:putative inorganic carbon (HCO3(-)) transporter